MYVLNILFPLCFYSIMSFISMFNDFEILYIVCGLGDHCPFMTLDIVDFEIWLIDASFVIE